MKFLLILLTSISLLSCTKPTYTPNPPEEEKQESTLTLSVQSQDLSITKSLTDSQESAVNNLNIYCYHKKSGMTYHRYISGKGDGLSFTMLNGECTIYAIANLNQDLGNMSETELKAYTYNISTESDLTKNSSIVMSYSRAFTLNNNMSLSIYLERILAKVDVEVNLSDKYGFFWTLQSVEVVNAPSSCSLFMDNKPTTNNVISYAKKDLSNEFCFSTTTSFYMMENAQGVNFSITNQKDKGKKNAPSAATYIKVSVYYAMEGMYEFYVYLGGNNTFDFNVFRNRGYKMIINIEDLNKLDCRVIAPVKARVTYAHRLDRIDDDGSAGHNGRYYRVDRYLTVTASVDRPSTHDVKVGVIGGVDGTLYKSYDEVNSSKERIWTTNPYIIIPAGETSATAELPTIVFGQDTRAYLEPLTECAVKEIIPHADDENNYYFVGYNSEDHQPFIVEKEFY